MAGFDIDCFEPRLVCIEVLPNLPEPIGEYFALHGYRHIKEYETALDPNWYFTPEE